MNRRTRARLWALADRLAPYPSPLLAAAIGAVLGVLLALWSTAP